MNPTQPLPISQKSLFYSVLHICKRTGFRLLLTHLLTLRFDLDQCLLYIMPKRFAADFQDAVAKPLLHHLYADYTRIIEVQVADDR